MRAAKSQCVLASFVATLAVTAGPALAVGISEGFEDGNWTVNPTWFDTNPGYGVDGGVVADPIRPNNLAWKAVGVGGAARQIATGEFAPMPWEGFHTSVEILNYGSICNVGMKVLSDLDYRSAEGFYVGFDVGCLDPNKARLQILERNQATWYYNPPILWDRTDIPMNEWLRVNLWHDAASGLIKADVRGLSDGHVYAQSSMVPTSFGALPLAYLELAAGAPGWNYLDNATLTPEPATLMLLALGGLAGMWRRRSVC